MNQLCRIYDNVLLTIICKIMWFSFPYSISLVFCSVKQKNKREPSCYQIKIKATGSLLVVSFMCVYQENM